MADTLTKLTEVFRDVFEEDDIALSRATTSADIEGWDSLMHVTLMLRVEQAFKVRFTGGEVTGLKDVGQLVDLIEKKVA